MLFLPLSIIIFLLLLLSLPLLFLLIQIKIVGTAFTKLGISPPIAILIFFLSLVGSTINIPLYFAHLNLINQQVIAINVGGAIIPLLICIYLLPKTPFLPTLTATLVSIGICYSLAKPIPGVGITIPALIPPLVSVLLSFILSYKNRVPVAYISGVLGVLIGADLLHLGSMTAMPGIMSIGGAGVFDGIFLVGILAALLS